MSRRGTVRDWSYAISKTWSRLTDNETTCHDGSVLEWTKGTVLTPDGVVDVYSQPGANAYSSYEAVVYGRHYIRTESIHRNHRGLAIQAGRFIREIVVEAYA